MPNNHDLEKLFDIHSEEYLEFDRIEHKRSKRPDLHAFLLIDELFPSTRDIVSASAYEQIYLDLDDAEVNQMTEEQIIELVRCGVNREEEDCYYMFT